MILTFFSIFVLTGLVQSNPQIPGIGGINGPAAGIADTVINTGKDVAKTVEGLIKNFDDFKTTFKKKYVDKAEELLREGIFNVSLALINDHNKLYEQGKSLFLLEMNFFADWTLDEYLKILGLQTMNSTNNATHHRNKRKSSVTCKFPEEKDWRKDGAVSPVKSQAQCGSCWAFATVASLESHFFIKTGKMHNFSEQQLVDCSTENNGCDGGFMDRAYKYIIKNGIVNSDEYPYVAQEKGEGRCSKLKSNVKISDYNFVANGNEADLRDAVCLSGPVTVGVDASGDYFRFYSKGIYANPYCRSENVNHAMLVVGYGVDKKTKQHYWIIKNSYDTDWGEGGYMRLAKDFNNHCGIANYAFYPVP